MEVDYTKPYCGNCGQQGEPVFLLKRAPDGEPLHICRDREACDLRFKQGLEKRKVGTESTV